MKLIVDTSRMPTTVTREPLPKVDLNGVQKIDRKSGQPLHVVQVMVLDPETGGEILNVAVAGPPPRLTVGQAVMLVELEAIPWATNGKNGVAFRAQAINAVNSAAKAA